MFYSYVNVCWKLEGEGKSLWSAAKNYICERSEDHVYFVRNLLHSSALFPCFN